MQGFYFEVKVGSVTVLSGSRLSGLSKITINDLDGEGQDTAAITLDDSGGQIYLPQKNDPVLIRIGRDKSSLVTRFVGFVSSAPYAFGQSGSTITVSCESGNPSGRAKEPLQKSFKNEKVESIFSKLTKELGLQMPKIDKQFADIKIDDVVDGLSLQEFGQKIASELGGKFKMFGDMPVLLAANSGKSISGLTLPAIKAVKGQNLISGTINPRQSSAGFTEHISQYFDRELGKWVQEAEKAVKSINATAKSLSPVRYANKQAAKQAAKAEKDGADRAAGSGSVKLDGDANIYAGSPISISGVRPGIDGQYRIKSCTHNLDKSGFFTDCQLEQPQGDAGIDKRVPKKPPSSSGAKVADSSTKSYER
ncbi:MAG: hypothetical protein OIF56_14895 [Cohaesibacter sp.]|nr:hypothetical protein [Cohaesibacter sp.]